MEDGAPQGGGAEAATTACPVLPLHGHGRAEGRRGGETALANRPPRHKSLHDQALLAVVPLSISSRYNFFMLPNLSTMSASQIVRHLHRISTASADHLIRHCTGGSSGPTDGPPSSPAERAPALYFLPRPAVLSLSRRGARVAPHLAVLRHLCAERDYATAAAVAGALIDGDGGDHGAVVLEGIDTDRLDGGAAAATALADLIVACLIKCGDADALVHFLGGDAAYDPLRACLVLVSTAASAASQDEDGGGDDADGTLHRLLRCLLVVAGGRGACGRGCTAEALLYFTTALPDVLLRDTPECVEAVTAIVGSDGGAADVLLKLYDGTYWEKLSDSLRLRLMVVNVHNKFPLLMEGDVKTWVQGKLDTLIEEIGSTEADPNDQDTLSSSEWLKSLVFAIVANAGVGLGLINVQDEETPEGNAETPGLLSSDPHFPHYAVELERDMATVREIIQAATSSSQSVLDLDLFIPALLILHRRSVPWIVEGKIPTGCLCDAACEVAGKRLVDYMGNVRTLGNDTSRLMIHCGRTQNLSAAGYLIGGRDGAVLRCCHVLVDDGGSGRAPLSVAAAEDALLGRSPLPPRGDGAPAEGAPLFVPTGRHQPLLLLLREGVLGVRTLGAFRDTAEGRLDPVSCARLCLRAWHIAGGGDAAASAWLVGWLRARLATDSGRARRLPSAALVAALLWPDDGASGDRTVLMDVLQIEMKFVVELCQACHGLLECLPPKLIEEIGRPLQHAVQ